MRSIALGYFLNVKKNTVKAVAFEKVQFSEKKVINIIDSSSRYSDNVITYSVF